MGWRVHDVPDLAGDNVTQQLGAVEGGREGGNVAVIFTPVQMKPSISSELSTRRGTVG